MKNFFLDLQELNSCTNEELLRYISLHVPQLVTSAWYKCLEALLHSNSGSAKIDAIYQTALKLKLRTSTLLGT